MFEFSESEDMEKGRGYDKRGGSREVTAHLYRTLIIKELKISVE